MTNARNYANWCLLPSNDAWARKLGAAAKLYWVNPEVPLPVPPTETAPKRIVDDDDGYVEESGGEWTPSSEDGGYGNDSRRHEPANPKPAAAWTITSLTPGRYNVYATWPAWAEMPDAENATFTVYTVAEGAESQYGDPVPVNQYSPPSGIEYEDRSWQLLTPDPCSVESNSKNVGIRVRITALTATDGIVADAILLVPVDNEVKLLSVVRSTSAPEETTAKVRVTLVEH